MFADVMISALVVTDGLANLEWFDQRSLQTLTPVAKHLVELAAAVATLRR